MANIILPIASIIPWSQPIDWAQPKAQETILLLVRHGETYGNDPSDEKTYTMTGCQTNFPLNENGHAQASGISSTLGDLQKAGALKVAGVFSSNLIRAKETVGYFSNALGVPAVAIEDLREINWGDADGKLVKFKTDQWGEAEKEKTKQFPDRKERWNHLPAIPNAEKYNEVLVRITPILADIGEKYKGNVVVIVTHGRVLKTLTADSLDKEEKDVPYPQNCGVAVFRYTVDKPLEFIEIRANK